ncbi:MAG: L,D-transpeptidase [Actinobacteria bacterium]|nr:L,D-transpeptidase [Actinomycetota bacterium]
MAAAVALSGCGAKGSPTLSPAVTNATNPAAEGPGADATSRTGPRTVAQAKAASVAVFHEPSAASPWMQLPSPNEDGAPRVFLVTARENDWLEVLLPVRPNGTKGWIRSSDVALSENDYRISIELGAHRITVWRGPEIIDQEPIGVGAGNTPTPGGEYYITELLAQPNPKGPYGPFAYGLSGYSDVLRSFAGADGVIGLHGTNDPAGLGHDVSHGCIRMSNAGITRLAKVRPLGTPVAIHE